MKIYISGKISGLDVADYTSKFNSAEARLKRCFGSDVQIINPLSINPFLGIKNWYCYMITDIWQLLKCDSVYLLDNWHDSRGARIEYKVAKWRNMWIFTN